MYLTFQGRPQVTAGFCLNCFKKRLNSNGDRSQSGYLGWTSFKIQSVKNSIYQTNFVKLLVEVLLCSLIRKPGLLTGMLYK